MAKSKEIEELAKEQTQQEKLTPANKKAENPLLAEMDKNSVVTLTSPSREQLQDDTLALLDAAKGSAYAGAVGFNAEKGEYTITLVKVKEK